MQMAKIKLTSDRAIARGIFKLMMILKEVVDGSVWTNVKTACPAFKQKRMLLC